MTLRRSSFGFTLIELSIVLVIIALIVGGVLAGKELIAAAKMRKVMAQVDGINAAVNSFRSKYNCIPGDCTTATNFFPATSLVSQGTCVQQPGDGTTTCNGDGNGFIRGAYGSANYWEMHHLFVQLSLAGLIEGKYLGGYVNGSSLEILPGINVPRINNSATDAMIITDTFPWGYGFSATYTANNFWLGSTTRPGLGYALYGNVFTPQQAWSFDKKIDDGRPGMGNVQIYNSTFNANCLTTDASPQAGYYRLTYTDLACNLFVKANF